MANAGKRVIVEKRAIVEITASTGIREIKETRAKKVTAMTILTTKAAKKSHFVIEILAASTSL